MGIVTVVAMDNAGHVIGSYVVTLGAIGLYAWAMLARARRSAKRLPDEERPWH